MDKLISVSGKDVKFRATARTPRLYRAIVGRDMIADMAKLEKSFKNIEKGEEYGWTVRDLYNKYMKDSNFFEYNEFEPYL